MNCDSIADLSLKNVLETARNVIRPTGWQCEWNTANNNLRCKIILTSWNAYLKHLLLHCEEQSLRSIKKGTYTCLLPRCTVPPGVAIELKDVSNHIQHAHLSRAALMCPISGCNTTFNRPASLEDHFEEQHANLIDTRTPLSSELVLPTWIPMRPASTQPTALPEQLPVACVLVSPVKGTWGKRPRTPLPTFIEGSSSQFSPSKRRAKMDHSDKSEAKASAVNDEKTSNSIVFDDLPKQLDRAGYFLLQESPLEGAVRSSDLRYDLSHPQRILDPIQYAHRQLTLTTSYEAFLSENPDINEEDDSGKGSAAPMTGSSAPSGPSQPSPSLRVPTPGSTFTSRNPTGAMTLS